MSEAVIICPECSAEIQLTQSLAAPLLEATRTQYEKRLAEVGEGVRKKELELKKQQDEVNAIRTQLDDEVAAKVNEARKSITAEEAKKAKQISILELQEKDKALADLQEVIANRETKLKEAQEAQAELLKKERALDDQKRELELTIEKRVQDSLQEERKKGEKAAEESMKLRVAEKEHTITALQKQIEDLKRRAEQGSQQLQGEVQEIELEELIRVQFPIDVVEPVPKGEFGGDVVHRVNNNTGTLCGTLLWESKRTKNWSDAWLPKLRGDQRAAKADFAILMSQTLPKGVDSFDLIDDVWITSPRNAVPLCVALRTMLIELAKSKRSQEGQQTKTELVYQYLTGPQFRHRVSAIVEKFTDMQTDLEKERRTMMRSWSKREEQIRLVIDSTAGMYGDLQAIAGSSLHEIEGLETPLLEDTGSDS